MDMGFLDACVHCGKEARYICNFCDEKVCAEHTHILSDKHPTCASYYETPGERHERQLLERIWEDHDATLHQ